MTDLLGELVTQQSQTLSDSALIDAMIGVEAALARVQGRLEIIPAAMGEAIDQSLQNLRIDPDELRPGMAASGVPVPALIDLLRHKLPRDAANYLHWGATSQDIVDTALVLCWRAYCQELAGRIDELGDELLKRMIAERCTPVLAHTRFQQAVPTVLGLRFASWLAPLTRHCERLLQLGPRLFVLQFGGAASNLSALGDQGQNVAAALAKELDLSLPPMPWHNQRDSVFELACLAANVSGGLGKMGLDILLAAQNEVGEMRDGKGGGSSTMPNKSNPVSAEALVTIARLQGGHLASLQQSLVHAQERDGTAWAMEWGALPPLLNGTIKALGHAHRLALTLVIDRDRMSKAIGAEGGLSLAEAASFMLCKQMPRDRAQQLVKAAVQDAKQGEMSLLDALNEHHHERIDQAGIMELATGLPTAQSMIDTIAGNWRQIRERRK